MMGNKIHLHIYPSYFTAESRILKITQSLIDSDITKNIHLVGIHKDGLDEKEQYDEFRWIWRVRLSLYKFFPFGKSLIKKWSWYFKVISYYLTKDVEVVQCNSIEDLPLGVLLKKLKKNVTLVYDAHELETEKNTIDGFKKTMARISERSLIKYADAVSVVSKCIADWYEREYNLEKVFLIRNVPYNHLINGNLENKKLLRKKFGIKDDELIFLYQGGLMTGRHLLMLLEVFKNLEDKSRHIVYMGYGYFEKDIKTYAEKYPNIHLQEAVDPRHLHEYTVDADVGLSIFENSYLSYYFCLPNKLYEYTLCSLPVVVSDFPEMSRAIFELKNGWVINPTYDEIFNFVSHLTKDEIIETQKWCKINKAHIGWHTEEKQLLEMYESVNIYKG